MSEMKTKTNFCQSAEFMTHQSQTSQDINIHIMGVRQRERERERERERKRVKFTEKKGEENEKETGQT